MTAPTGPADERDATAGEYVLGTLGPAERAAFERELARDAALRGAVYAWQDRLLGLAGQVAPVEPAVGAWSAIEARIEGGGADPATATPATAAAPTTSPMSASATGPASGSTSASASGPASASAFASVSAAPAANDPSWRRLRRWQGASAAGFLLSAGLGTLLWLRGTGDMPPSGPVLAGTRYVAVLEASDRSTGWLVEATAGGALHLVPVGAAPPLPAGRTLQFWTKAEGAAGPTSLGLVRAAGPVELPVARLPALGIRQLFELTLEPAEGSPLGRPTGPVMYLGRTVRL